MVSQFPSSLMNRGYQSNLAFNPAVRNMPANRTDNKPTLHHVLENASTYRPSEASTTPQVSSRESPQESFEEDVKYSKAAAIPETKTDEILSTLKQHPDRRLFNENGGLSILDGAVLLGTKGLLGYWNGFRWKEHKPTTKWDMVKITHDAQGCLWNLNRQGELSRLLPQGSSSIGLVGGRDLVDVHFDKSDRLWGVSRTGDVSVWNGYVWDDKEVLRFKKTTCICFDRFGYLWGLNSCGEIGKWDGAVAAWDIKIIPPRFKPVTLAFDTFNRLWGLNAEGCLAQVSGSQWIQLGNVASWEGRDLSFQWE